MRRWWLRRRRLWRQKGSGQQGRRLRDLRYRRDGFGRDRPNWIRRLRRRRNNVPYGSRWRLHDGRFDPSVLRLRLRWRRGRRRCRVGWRPFGDGIRRRRRRGRLVRRWGFFVDLRFGRAGLSARCGTALQDGPTIFGRFRIDSVGAQAALAAGGRIDIRQRMGCSLVDGGRFFGRDGGDLNVRRLNRLRLFHEPNEAGQAEDEASQQKPMQYGGKGTAANHDMS